VKVVVTGGAGFIGANLCRALVAVGDTDEVVALDDLSSGLATNLDGVEASLVVGDMGDPDVLDAVLPGSAAVVHLGARPSVPRSIEDPMATHHANATGTLQVLEGVRRHGIGHVVVASSSSVYGSNPDLPKHEGLVPMPVSPYAASKLASEAYALAHAATFDFRALVLRFFNVFGPLQTAGHAYAAVVPAFVAAALAERPGLTVITNSIEVARPLVAHGGRRVYIAGGVIRADLAAVVGPVALGFIAQFRADLAILSIGGLHAVHGFTDFHLDETRVAQAMLARADEAIVVADRAKFGVRAAVAVCPFERIGSVVTDAQPEGDLAARLAAAGVAVVAAAATG
jgi:nucleoside-diphosphate-sugar epimerase